MRRIHFVRTANDVTENNVKGRTAVVVDVLRATSTIVTALHHGCRAVIPVKEVAEAFAAADQFRTGEFILGGEREGKRVPGFHFGNSPQEYTPQAVAGKVVITTTTNGTHALVNSAPAEETLVLSFLNLTAVAERVIKGESDLCLIAAGSYGKFSVEDAACCGFLANRLSAGGNHFHLTPAAQQIARLAADYEGRVLQLLHDSPHGEFLQQIGFGSDLAVCAQLDTCPVTPIYRQGRITIPN